MLAASPGNKSALRQDRKLAPLQEPDIDARTGNVHWSAVRAGETLPVADVGSLAFIRRMADKVAQSGDAIRDHVVSALRRVTLRKDAITETTELYYDLGLAGEDLGDAIDAIGKPFGTDFSLMDLRQYAPNEVGHNFGINFLREFREWRGQRTYRSLTVASIIVAVQAGSWNDG